MWRTFTGDNNTYNYTGFEKSCRLSSNISAWGFSSCFTLVRSATTFNNAQSRCTEFSNGRLARIDSVEMAQFISTKLWANVRKFKTAMIIWGLTKEWWGGSFVFVGYKQLQEIYVPWKFPCIRFLPIAFRHSHSVQVIEYVRESSLHQFAFSSNKSWS